jgi:hypothetical protein
MRLRRRDAVFDWSTTGATKQAGYEGAQSRGPMMQDRRADMGPTSTKALWMLKDYFPQYS